MGKYRDNKSIINNVYFSFRDYLRKHPSDTSNAADGEHFVLSAVRHRTFGRLGEHRERRFLERKAQITNCRCACF